MAMTLTGMATVLPVRIAVLMISVSCREGGALLSGGACGPLLSQDTPAKAQAPGCPTPQMHDLPLRTPAHMCRQVQLPVSLIFSHALLTWPPAVAFWVYLAPLPGNNQLPSTPYMPSAHTES